MPIRPVSVLDNTMIVASVPAAMMFDDSSSVDSTEECVSYIYAHQSKKVRACTKKFRRVMFNEDANESYCNNDSCSSGNSSSPISTREQEDTKELWYSATEYSAFKRNNTQAAREVIREELDRKKETGSYLDVMGRVFEACCCHREIDSVEASELERILSDSCSSSFFRVGLERLTVRRIRLDKKNRRQELLDTVLEIQEENEHLSVGERAELISLAVRDITRPSRLFAMNLAAATAKA